MALFFYDKEETVKKRLEVYHKKTKPLIEYYSEWSISGEEGAPEYVQIEGVGSVEEIRDNIFEVIN